MAQPEPEPFHADDLIRRLNAVLAEQHVQEMKLAQKMRRQDSELYKLGRKLHLRGRKNAEVASDNNDETKSQHSISTQQSHGSSDGESRRSARWGFRTNPTGPAARQSDDDDSATTAECSPQNTHTMSKRTTSTWRAQPQRTFKSKKHGISHQLDSNHAVVLDLKDIDEIGDEHIEDTKENCPPDWARTDALEARPRGLQLMKRISSISALKTMRGGEARGSHDGREASRTKSDPIKEGSTANRKSNPFLKIRR